MTEIEESKNTLNKVRYHSVLDSLDYYELMRADIEIQCWNEFVNDLYKIILT